MALVKVILQFLLLESFLILASFVLLACHVTVFLVTPVLLLLIFAPHVQLVVDLGGKLAGDFNGDSARHEVEVMGVTAGELHEN